MLASSSNAKSAFYLPERSCMAWVSSSSPSRVSKVAECLNMLAWL